MMGPFLADQNHINHINFCYIFLVWTVVVRLRLTGLRELLLRQPSSSVPLLLLEEDR